MEPCLFAKRTHLILPVPLFVCPGFLTELLLLKWRLHFEFTTSVAPLEGQNLQDEDKGILWQEWLSTQIEELSCMLKWDASYRWSFGPNSAWGRIETTIIGKTHPTLF